MPAPFKLLVAAVAAAATLPAGGAAAGAGMADLLVLDCDGAVRVMPGNGAAGSVAYTPALKPAAEYLQQLVLDKAACHCPALSEAERKDAFELDFGNVVRRANAPGAATPAAVEACDFKTTLYDMFGFATEDTLEMPDSCSADKWDTDGTCFLKAVTNGNLDLQLAVAKCEESPLPFVSLSCAGDLCESFMRPCESSSDCGTGVACDEFPALSASTFLSHLVTAVTESNVFGAAEGGSSCGSTASQAAASAMGVASDLAKSMLGGEMASGSFSFCGVRRVLEGDDADSFKAPQKMITDLFTPCNAGDDAAGDAACTAANGFGSWDGVLAGGGSAVADNRLDGSAWPELPKTAPATDGRVDGDSSRAILELTCESRLSVLPGSPFEVSAMNPNPHRLVAAIQEQLVKPMFECRGDSASYGAAQFAAFQNLVSPAFWLDVASNDNSTSMPRGGETVRDALGGSDLTTGDTVNGLIAAWNQVLELLSELGFEPFERQDNYYYDEGSKFFSDVDSNMRERLNTQPVAASCSAAHLASHGVCAVKWTKVGEAIGKDVAVTLTLGGCRGGLAPPSVRIGCVGDDCDEVIEVWNAAKLCEDDSQCESDAVCERLEGHVDPLVGKAMWGAGEKEVVDTEDSGIVVVNWRLKFGYSSLDDVEAFASEVLQAQEDLGYGGMELRGALVRANPESSYDDSYYDCNSMVVTVTARVASEDAANTFLDGFLAAVNNGPADRFSSATMNDSDCTNNTFVVYESYEYSDGQSYDSLVYEVSRCPNGTYWYEYFDETCPGDSCANSDLFKGEALAGIAKVAGIPVPAGTDLEQLGVCRPKWLDDALKYDWSGAMKEEVEVANGLATVQNLEPFCEACTGFSDGGGDDDDDDDDDDLSAATVPGTALSAVAAALVAAVAAHRA